MSDDLLFWAILDLLLGCTAEEMTMIHQFLNSHGPGCIVLSRPTR